MNRSALAPTDVLVDPPGLPGILRIPNDPMGVVIFAHGAGSSRLSPRNTAVAEQLGGSRMATLLFDLLTEPEARDRAKVFDIALLSQRIVAALAWAGRHPELSLLPRGLFGASTGAAAALVAAAEPRCDIKAVVSRGGRPDLAGDALSRVRAPTLLIVGGADTGVIELNARALAELNCPKQMAIIPGATHLFAEPGALEQVVALAAAWFRSTLVRETP